MAGGSSIIEPTAPPPKQKDEVVPGVQTPGRYFEDLGGRARAVKAGETTVRRQSLLGGKE